jgi:hypothetical protein
LFIWLKDYTIQPDFSKEVCVIAYRKIKCSKAKGNKKKCLFKLNAGKYGLSRIIQGECDEHGGFLIISLAMITLTDRRLIEEYKAPIAGARGIHPVD